MNAEGDKVSRFESIMVPHLDAAYNLARWLTRSQDEANEVVQEAYLRAFRYFDSFTGSDGRGWLLTIIRNCCFNSYRGRRQDVAFDERSHSAEAGQVTAEEAMVKRDAAGALRDCIEGLPPEFRETLIMRELEDFSYKQIAEVTVQPVGTIMSRLSRARKRLQDCMAAKGVR